MSFGVLRIYPTELSINGNFSYIFGTQSGLIFNFWGFFPSYVFMYSIWNHLKIWRAPPRFIYRKNQHDELKYNAIILNQFSFEKRKIINYSTIINPFLKKFNVNFLLKCITSTCIFRIEIYKLELFMWNFFEHDLVQVSALIIEGKNLCWILLQWFRIYFDNCLKLFSKIWLYQMRKCLIFLKINNRKTKFAYWLKH